MLLTATGGFFSAHLCVQELSKVSPIYQGCGSGAELDQDSIGSVDPDPESGSRRAKVAHNKRKIKKYHVLVLDVLF